MSEIEIKNRINIALKFLKETRGFNQNQIAQKLAVTPGTITRLRNGENALTESMALLFEYIFGISSKWLIDGEGEMLFFPTNIRNKEDIDFLHRIYNRKGMKILIENLLCLSDRDLAVIQVTVGKLNS
ncbi:helix-turn-helix transcriptional regulator [Leptospira kirschneri]|uniref:DNA-binding helix-turn-helix protein n=1 Tax=Leptospira kirschneri str. H1 TaxID=1049966 RepID=A0A0E2B604_9LEPT|nr:transcriptional regulator [Leptospira kirschneri]EKO16280.1 DNA-binding helix-turn-helix protein [Leptospira kirschneri str. H1]UML82305.1 transcriptional regulator [Leptospira kirschneri]UML82348.1 transcriptional regulator [Leptospira kirschneri]